MSYQPIENYGIIGNMRTVALVGMNGSIDWYCYPQFDSPSTFGAILDDKKGGRCQISAGAEGVRHKQVYWPSTNVLVTRFLLGDGIAELEDFMGCPGSRHPSGRKACASSRSHEMGAREGPYLRRSNDARLERETPGIYTVSRQ